MGKLLLIILFSLILNGLDAQNADLDRAKKLIYTDPETAITLVSPYLDGPSYIQSKAYAIMANANEKLGKYVAAYAHYTKSINKLLASDTLDHYLEYAVYNNMAKIASESNQYKVAADLYGRAGAAAERYVKYHPKVAAQYKETYLPNKANFYRANALYDAGLTNEALDSYLKLDLQFKNKVEDLNTFALLRNEYGLNAKAGGDYEGAKYYFRSVLAVQGVAGFYKQSAMHNLAMVYKKDSLYAEAITYLDSAINLQGATPVQYYISHMDKGELLLLEGRNKEAVVELEKALQMGVDISYDLRLMKVYYFLERAAKSIDVSFSNAYGDQYQALVDDHIRHQAEIIAQEKARVFALGLNEANHLEMIKSLERKHLIETILYALLFTVLAILITCVVVSTYIKLKIRRTIRQ